MSTASYEVVICGAGIAGISAAYHLSKMGVSNILLVDERPPLSLTSDRSTECYRNWWPGPGDAMVQLMNRSIDILEQLARETSNIFHLNRRGYLYVTAEPSRVKEFQCEAQEISNLGAGPVRIHAGSERDPVYRPAARSGFESQPSGVDLITDRDLIHTHFPYLASTAKAVLHARRCGWFSAQQLGRYMLGTACELGVVRIQARLTSVEIQDSQIRAVHCASKTGPLRLLTRHFINAAGPYLPHVGNMLGLKLPVYSELHLKIAFRDTQKIIPRDAPLLIWSDPQFLHWSKDERRLLQADQEVRFTLDRFPPGVHCRPEGGVDSPMVIMLWAYDTHPTEPKFPITPPTYHPELVLRGLTAMIPEMKRYLHQMPKPIMDGGYYTQTSENRPLIGPLPVRGAWIIGALSGFGLMAAPGAGELLAMHITRQDLPSYARWFQLDRYADPTYLKLLDDWGETGQL